MRAYPAWFIRLSAAFFLCLSLVGCGTVTPIPAHGGGKRFAVEQMLVSASMRKAVSEIPSEPLRDRKVVFETSIVYDEGAGALNGGRPFVGELLNLQNQSTRNSVSGDLTRSRQAGVGLVTGRSDTAFVKDASFNNSDAKQFSNLLVSWLARQNVMINPNPDTEVEADYFLEVIVDVLGTWRSRTDWLVTNSEQLKAIVALEYTITPLRGHNERRLSGRIAYEASYLENYFGWLGPTETRITLTRSALGDLLPAFGPGSDRFSNLRRTRPAEFQQPDAMPPIQISPKSKP